MLAVFLPMLLLSVVHIHEGVYTDGDSCTECVNHIPHAGHLSINASHHDDCVLCQFTSQSFVEAVTVAVATVPVLHDVVFIPQPRPLRSTAAFHAHLPLSVISFKRGIRASGFPL